ncbi:MAG: hypothetical protein M1840_004137 [Geoglossum simile]|nr:MAG: hypothetical protein M1840_004137 [Geoglossum simile]
MERLTEEIHRVLNSPYTVSLKGLHDITREADACLLELWALSHQCEIEALASVVIDSLSWCPFAAPVLETLVTTERLRSAILHQRPALLDALLKKAVISQQNFEKYSQICVSMLSAPLPVPVPVSLGPFFRKSLKEATRSPTTCTLRRVYALVSGQCATLPGILPAEQVVDAQEQLLSVLKHQDGQFAHLFCLGMFARLVASQRCPPPSASNTLQSSTPSTESGSTNSAGIFSLISGFFSAQRAPKTIELVVLQVISACSSNSGLSGDEALENAQLATVIMDAIEPSLRDAWVKANGRVMRKLYEKVLRRGIPSLLQFLGFEFVLCMTDAKYLPPAFPKDFQTLTLGKLRCQTMDNRSIRLSANTVEKMASFFEEDFISEALCIVLSTITRPDLSTAHVSRLKSCQAFLDGISETAEHSPIFRRRLISSLSTNELAEPLREFCGMSIPERQLASDCGMLKLCWSEFQESRRHLALSLCLLILKAALHSSHSSDDGCGIRTSLALSLLSRQKDFAIPVPQCPPAQRNRTGMDLPPVAFLEQKSTPQVIRASHDWKKRLAEGLLRDASQRHELIVNTVSEVCRDLEERCEDMERPLREEQAKLSSARARLDESDLRTAALEVEVSERELFIDGLEAEKQRLESQVSSISQRSQELEHLLQQATDTVLDTKVAASDDIKEMELNHLAVVSVKDERISELDQKIQGMERELRRLGDEIEATAEEKFEAQGNLMMIQRKLAESSITLDQEKAINILKHTEVDSLSRLNEALRTNVETLNHDLRESSSQAEKMRSEFQEAQKLLSSELEITRNGRETDALEAAEQVRTVTLLPDTEILTTKRQAARAKILHDREMDEVRAFLRNERQDLSIERRQNELKVLELETEIKELRTEREERAREFLHAQDLSRRLIAVMGVSSTSPRPSDLTIEGKGDVDTFTDDLQGTDNGENLSRENGTGMIPRNDNSRRSKRGNGNCEGGDIPAGSCSPARGGSTPKRSKVHKPAKPSSMQPTEQIKVMAGKATKSYHLQNRRSPLGELVAGNRNGARAATLQKAYHSPSSQPDQISVTDGLQESMDLEGFSFDGSEFTASTPMH